MDEVVKVSKLLDEVLEMFEYIKDEEGDGSSTYTLIETPRDSEESVVGSIEKVEEVDVEMGDEFFEILIEESPPKTTKQDGFETTEEYIVKMGPLYKYIEYPIHKYLTSRKILNVNKKDKTGRQIDVFLYVCFLIYELYKISIGSFLILFVQQQCGATNCNVFENVFVNKTMYDVSLVLNCICFSMFILLYSIEITRERYLKRELTISDYGPGIIGLHRSQIGEKMTLDNLMKDLKTKYHTTMENHPVFDNVISNKIIKQIEYYNTVYKYLGSSSFAVFFVNFVFSSVTIIINNSQNQKSILGIITNTFIIAPKFYDVYLVVSSNMIKTMSSSIKKLSDYNNYSDENFYLIKNEVDRLYYEFMKDNSLEKPVYSGIENYNNTETV